MKVYCNPYAEHDRGRLAGACPMEPKHRAGERAYVAAEIKLLSKEERKGDPRGDREVYGFTFSAEPLVVPPTPYETALYYAQRARSGEVFAPRDGRAPLAQWREARAALVARMTAEFGAAPDTSGWAEQFPLDTEIAGSGGGEK